MILFSQPPIQILNEKSMWNARSFSEILWVWLQIPQLHCIIKITNSQCCLSKHHAWRDSEWIRAKDDLLIYAASNLLSIGLRASSPRLYFILFCLKRQSRLLANPKHTHGGFYSNNHYVESSGLMELIKYGFDRI